MAFDERVRALEQRLGKPVVLRGVRDPDPRWRGWLTERPSHFLLEYRDATVGFFWHHDIIRELLDLLEQGRTEAVLTDKEEGREQNEE